MSRYSIIVTAQVEVLTATRAQAEKVLDTMRVDLQQVFQIPFSYVKGWPEVATTVTLDPDASPSIEDLGEPTP